VPHELLADNCRRFLEHPQEMEQLRLETYEAFKTRYRMDELLGRMIR